MPVSKKPRRTKPDNDLQPAAFTLAGSVFYSWFEGAHQALQRYRAVRATRSRRTTRQTPHGLRERARRLRQGVFHTQHPSVIARFASHPTRAEIEAVIADVEKPKGAMRTMADAVLALNPLRKIEGETKSDRDARIKREKRSALTLEAMA